MDLFNLAAKITLDTSEYERGLTSAQGKWNGMGDFIRGGAGKIAKVGAVALGAASAAVVAFGKKSIDAGMRFDSSMSQVAATMGVTMAELQTDIKTTDTAYGQFTGNLREYAEFMGKNTAFSASEAADALNYMALAGYDTQTSMDMVPNVLHLAAAGGMELAAASDMVTDAQTALGLNTFQTTELVDKMAKTASKSNTSVSQLGEAILTVGGTAKSLKGGTTELSAALGVLADNGIKGAEGGTALRNVLLGIQSKKFDKTFGALGVSAYDADGNLRPINETLADMNKAMEGMTEQEKTSLITKTFNKADLKSVNALLGTTSDRWSELYGEITTSTGAAQEMADVQLDNLAGDVTLFKSALEGAEIAISDALNPTLRNLVQEGTSGLQRLTDAFSKGGFSAAIDVAADLVSEWTQKLVEGIPKVLEIGGKLLFALGKGILKAVPGVLKGIGTIGKDLIGSIQRSIGSSIPGMSKKIGSTLRKQSRVIKNGFMDMFGAGKDNFKIMLSTGTQMITSIIDGIASALPTMIHTGSEILNALITGIIESIPSLITSAGMIITSTVNYFMTAAPALMQAGIDIINNIMNGFTNNGSAISTAVSTALTSIGTAITNGLPTLLSKGGELLQTIANGITAAIPMIATAAGNILTAIGGWISANAPSLIEKGAELFKQVITGIGNAVMNIGSALGNIITGIVDWINGDGGAELPAKGAEIWEAIKNGIATAIGAIGETLMNLLSGITTWVTTNYDSIAQAGKNILTYIVEGIVAVASNIATGMLALIGAAASWIINNAGTILSTGKTIVTYIIKGIVEAVKLIGNGFVNLVSNIGDWIVANSGGITQLGTDILDWIIKGISDFIGKFKDGFNGTVAQISAKITSISASLINLGLTILLKIKDGIANNLSKIKDGFTGLVGHIRDKINGMATSLANVGGKIVDGIKAGITGVTGLATKIGDLIKSAVASATSKTYNANVKIAAQTGYKAGGADTDERGQARARYKPYLFNKATVFGRYNGVDQVAGEAGPEMLLGTHALQDMLYTSVQGGMQSMMGQIYEMLSGIQGGGGDTALEAQILDVLNRYLPGIADKQLVLDSGALAGAVAPGVNTLLGSNVTNRRRYNA